MEKNGWKFIVFVIIVLLIIIGGFVLMKQSFPKNNTTKVVKKENKKKVKDIRIDKNKDYIYFENSETLAHDLDIGYKDVVFNFKNYESIQNKLNDETREYKDTIVVDEEQEDFDNVVKATYKTYEYYLFDNYISLLVNYYTFDRDDLISYIDSDTYVFDKEIGSRINEDELLSKFNLTKSDVLDKIEDYLKGQDLLKEEELDIDGSIDSLDDLAIFVDRFGRLSISILVKNDQKDYNEVIVLS